MNKNNTKLLDHVMADNLAIAAKKHHLAAAAWGIPGYWEGEADIVVGGPERLTRYTGLDIKSAITVYKNIKGKCLWGFFINPAKAREWLESDDENDEYLQDDLQHLEDIRLSIIGQVDTALANACHSGTYVPCPGDAIEYHIPYVLDGEKFIKEVSYIYGCCADHNWYRYSNRELEQILASFLKLAKDE